MSPIGYQYEPSLARSCPPNPGPAAPQAHGARHWWSLQAYVDSGMRLTPLTALGTVIAIGCREPGSRLEGNYRLAEIGGTPVPRLCGTISVDSAPPEGGPLAATASADTTALQARFWDGVPGCEGFHLVRRPVFGAAGAHGFGASRGEEIHGAHKA